jgi:hypothetical protein
VQQFFYADRENAGEARLCVGVALFFWNSVIARISADLGMIRGNDLARHALPRRNDASYQFCLLVASFA